MKIQPIKEDKEMKIVPHKGRFIGYKKGWPPIIGLSPNDVMMSLYINIMSFK